MQARDHASRQRFTIFKGETDVVIDIVNEGPRDAKRPPFEIARGGCKSLRDQQIVLMRNH